MYSGHYDLVRLEHELRLQALQHPLGPPRRRRELRVPQLRRPRRTPRPLMQVHEYLELEFTVDERR